MMLDRHLDLELPADFGVLGLDVRERDVFLEKRRPAPARRIARLLVVVIDRHARAPRRRWKLRRETDVEIQGFERIPVDFDADEAPLRSFAAFVRQRFAADELTF